MGTRRHRAAIWRRVGSLRANATEAAHGLGRARTGYRPTDLSRHARWTHSTGAGPHSVACRLNCFWAACKRYSVTLQETPSKVGSRALRTRHGENAHASHPRIG